jgi:hypothetical protein
MRIDKGSWGWFGPGGVLELLCCRDVVNERKNGAGRMAVGRSLEKSGSGFEWGGGGGASKRSVDFIICHVTGRCYSNNKFRQYFVVPCLLL